MRFTILYTKILLGRLCILHGYSLYSNIPSGRSCIFGGKSEKYSCRSAWQAETLRVGRI